MEPLKIFDDFNLDHLDPEWINWTWENEFLTFKEIPEQYVLQVSSDDIDILLKDSYSVVKNWINDAQNDTELDDTGSEFSWQTLIGLNINPRALLSLLGYTIHNGQSIDADEDARQSCLRASSLYFALLTIPGSNAFQVFHPNLYHRALSTLKLSELLIEKIRKPSKESDNAYDNDDPMEVLSNLEKLTLTKGLNSVMFDLIKMLQGFHMQGESRSLEITVYTLLEVAKLATDSISAKRSDASINSLAHNAYSALNLLCDSKHGPVDITIRLIAKYMLPILISNQVEHSSKDLLAMRDCMICFLKNLLEDHESEARVGVTTLIQHLLIKFPERAELRQKQASMVTKLINACDADMYAKAVEDLIILAHHNKVTARIFSLEIMGEFLFEMEIDGCNLLSKLKSKKLLLGTVLSRCNDTSSLVRSKAMAAIAESTCPRNNIALTTIQEIFEGSDKDKPLPNIELLRQAVLEDKDVLPGSNTIISIVVARLEDERAHVRRSSIQILGNLVSLFVGLLDIVVSSLGHRCRDPAITVRCHAIHIMTQILEQFPEHSSLLEEWVLNVLPLIFDIEIKVQERVLESLQHLVLDHIKYFTANDRDPMINLPWALLDKISKLKMQKHLSKACTLWENISLIKPSLISKIQSHLGTEHDIAAWMLLAAMASNRELPHMTAHFKNYKEYIRGKTIRSNLALEVLKNSWLTLDKSFLKTFQSDLFDCLCKFQVSFNLISVCCDIFADITKYLNPENGEHLVKLNAVHLMKISEAELENFFDNIDNAEEVSPIYLKAICTLGNASHLCTEPISQTVLRTLQGLVLEWNTLPVSFRCKEIRAVAITLLGQQALRDRDIAQQVMPILGHLMRTSAESAVDAAVKVNAAKALADICVRFTALVEPYLVDMCVSMKDTNPSVREAIVVLFIQLLLEDFIKVKGPFFFHILTMLTDSDAMVRELTMFLVNERLLTKNKTLISRQFLESIFHYNNYKLRNKFIGHKLSERESLALTLPRQKNQSQRHVIYNFMLEHLDPPGKLKLITTLTREVLRAAISGTLNFKSSEGLCVLKDVLYILSRDELQPSSCTKHTDEDNQDENVTPTASPTNNATNVIVEAMKKHTINVLLPTLIQLKRKLVKSGSPFAINIARYYLKIVEHYSKEQVSGLYHEYPEMENEIANDLRQYRQTATSETEDELESVNEKTSNETNYEIISKNCPRIVLRRLSTLTYPGINVSRSPSQSSISDDQSPQARSWRNRGVVSSPSYSLHAISPSVSRPGPSNSTPTTSRTGYARRSPNYSPIPALPTYSIRNYPDKGLSTIPEDEQFAES